MRTNRTLVLGLVLIVLAVLVASVAAQKSRGTVSIQLPTANAQYSTSDGGLSALYNDGGTDYVIGRPGITGGLSTGLDGAVGTALTTIRLFLDRSSGRTVGVQGLTSGNGQFYSGHSAADTHCNFPVWTGTAFGTSPAGIFDGCLAAFFGTAGNGHLHPTGPYARFQFSVTVPLDVTKLAVGATWTGPAKTSAAMQFHALYSPTGVCEEQDWSSAGAGDIGVGTLPTFIVTRTGQGEWTVVAYKDAMVLGESYGAFTTVRNKLSCAWDQIYKETSGPVRFWFKVKTT